MERSLPSYRFARRLNRRAARPVRAPGDIVGIENAFEVVERGDRLDFRTLIDDVVGGEDRRWLPGDPHARYLPSGALVSCEEREAILAIPPVPMQRGVATLATDELLARRAELGALVRRFNAAKTRGVDLRGYAARMNVFIPGGRAPQVALRFARTAAPAAMLLLDLAASPGALVRANGRRLELAGEYVAGRDDMRVAMTFFLAASLAVERGLPLPELEGTLLDDPMRGWFVDRLAFGDDVYVAGRMAALRLAGGGTILAGTLLGEIWATARPLAEQHATRAELAIIDDTVSGARALPLEREPSAEPQEASMGPVQDFARVLRERRRGDVLVRPVAVTWEAATLAVTTPSRTFYARLPAEAFGAFATSFERGSLDKVLRAYSGQESRGRLASLETLDSGLFDVAEVPEPDAGGISVRVGSEAPLPSPKQRRPVATKAIKVARRAAAFSGAALMFAGTAAFAYIGLKSSEPRPIKPQRQAQPAVPRPSTSVLAEKQTREPSATPTTLAPVPSTTPIATPTGGIATPPRPDTRHDDPSPATTSTPRQTTTSTPRPTATSTPRPTATSTPRPTATSTPRPTATPTPTPPPPPPAAEPTINGSTSCGVKTSNFSFTITTASGAPKITNMVVTYSGQQVQPAPSPFYPASSYSGSASAPVAPNSSHKWYIKVQDQSGKQYSKTFTDRCS